jgi:hypothetical protein
MEQVPAAIAPLEACEAQLPAAAAVVAPCIEQEPAAAAVLVPCIAQEPDAAAVDAPCIAQEPEPAFAAVVAFAPFAAFSHAARCAAVHCAEPAGQLAVAGQAADAVVAFAPQQSPAAAAPFAVLPA